MDNQIVSSAREKRNGEEDECNANKLETIVSNVGLLSRRQVHLADMQVQAIHVAKGYIDDRVNSAEQQARNHAEILGHALTQVQVDHHVLKEHLSIYLQGIAESARQQINGVYEDLHSRHIISLQTYDQRVFEIDKETRATKDAVKANDQSVQRILANQFRIDAVEHELKEAKKVIESQATSMIEFARRIGVLEEQIATSNGLETRIFERVDKMLATAQFATASTVARLSGRMDRYDERTARTTGRLDQLVGDAKKELKRTIENQSKDLHASLLNTESRVQLSAVSLARFDEASSSIQASIAAQKDELLAVQTHVAQLVTSQSRAAVPEKLKEHSEQIALINNELEKVERETLIADEAQANTNQAIRDITATQGQQHAMIQQLLLRLPPSAQLPVPVIPYTCEQHHSLAARVGQLADLIVRQQASQHAMEAEITQLACMSQPPVWQASSESVEHGGTLSVEAKFAQLSGRVAQLQDSHRALQVKVDKLDISVEDRIVAWFNHVQAVQDVRLNALFERDETSESSASEEETNSDETSNHSATSAPEGVVLNFAAGGARRLDGDEDVHSVPTRDHHDQGEFHTTTQSVQGVDGVPRRRTGPVRRRNAAQVSSETSQSVAPVSDVQSVLPHAQRNAPQHNRLTEPAQSRAALDDAYEQSTTPPVTPPARRRAPQQTRPAEHARRGAGFDSEADAVTTPPVTPPARRRAPQQTRPAEHARRGAGFDSEADAVTTPPVTPPARRRAPQQTRPAEQGRRGAVPSSEDDGARTPPVTPPAQRHAHEQHQFSDPVQNSLQQRSELRRSELRRAAREATQEVLAEHHALVSQVTRDTASDGRTSQRRERRLQHLDLAEHEDQAVRQAARDQALRAMEDLGTGQVQSPSRRDRNLRARLAARELTRQSPGQQPSPPVTSRARIAASRPPNHTTQAGARSSRRTNRSPATRTADVNAARNSAQEEIRRRADERARGLAQ